MKLSVILAGLICLTACEGELFPRLWVGSKALEQAKAPCPADEDLWEKEERAVVVTDRCPATIPAGLFTIVHELPPGVEDVAPVEITVQTAKVTTATTGHHSCGRYTWILSRPEGAELGVVITARVLDSELTCSMFPAAGE